MAPNVKTESEQQVAYARAALQSLGNSRIKNADQYVDRWFVDVFNDWYQPAVHRGYRGEMAWIFDLALLLAQPGVKPVPPSDPYSRFIEDIHDSSLLIDAQQIYTTAPNHMRVQVGWMLIEGWLRRLGDVWGEGDGSAEPPAIFPTLVAAGCEVEVREPGEDGDLLGSFSTEFEKSRARGAQVLVPADPTIVDRIRLFIAHMSCRWHDAADRLDYEVVEACLRGPNLRPQDHEPPPHHLAEIEMTDKSVQRGKEVGPTGLTRKQDDDSWFDVYPPEWRTVRHDRRKGLGALVMRPPLVIERQSPVDLIPKHRALVCFIVHAFEDAPQLDTRIASGSYRHPYVYAKRQVFDLVRDLREALERVRRTAHVDVDIAMFAVRPVGTSVFAAYKFSLDQLPLRENGDAGRDHYLQLRKLSDIAPSFFEQMAVARTPVPAGDPAERSFVDGSAVQYLMRQARKGGYKAIHEVVIGAAKDLRRLSRAANISTVDSPVRPQLTLVAVDLLHADSDRQLSGTSEPQWSYKPVKVRNAPGHFEGPLPTMQLSDLRKHLVASVLGKPEEPKTQVRTGVKLAESTLPA